MKKNGAPGKKNQGYVQVVELKTGIGISVSGNGITGQIIKPEELAGRKQGGANEIYYDITGSSGIWYCC